MSPLQAVWKGFSKVLTPPLSPPHPPSVWLTSLTDRNNVWLLAIQNSAVWASVLCDLKRYPFFLRRPSLLLPGLLWAVPSRSWLHVEGWCIDHRQSFDSGMHQYTNNSCSRVNVWGLESSSQRSFIYFRLPFDQFIFLWPVFCAFLR